VNPTSVLPDRVVAVRRPAPRALGPSVLALSLAGPVVLVAGTVLAEAVQPPGSYHPVAQTVSTLAGRGAADPWLMSGTLAVLGVIYLAVAAGLHAVPRAARFVLGVGAVAYLSAALAPQPVHGSSAAHMISAVVGFLAFVGWPLALAADRGLDPRLRRGSVAATAVMTVALGWLCAQAWTDGTWLGAAERLLLLAEMVWPIRIAAESWRRSAGDREPPGTHEMATLALAVLAPIVVVVGLLATQAVHPMPDLFGQSLSALARRGAPTRWIMTWTLGVTGALSVLVAMGLRRLPTPPRLVLALGGAMVVVVALAPQPVGGSSALHMASAGVAWAAFTAWPLALACSPSVEDRLRRTSAVAAVVLLLPLLWFGVELIYTGSWYGLSERVVVAAQPIWVIRMAVAAVRRPPAVALSS
jgi:hypothetical membrane protein